MELDNKTVKDDGTEGFIRDYLSKSNRSLKKNEFQRKKILYDEINRLRVLDNKPKLKNWRTTSSKILYNIFREMILKKKEEIKKLQEEEIKKRLSEVKEFFNNPSEGKKIRINNIYSYIPDYLRIYDDYHLLLHVKDGGFLTINKYNFRKIINEIFSFKQDEDVTGSEITIINHFLRVEDTNFYDEKNEKIRDIELIWVESKKERKTGAYFKYYHNLNKIDLKRYGIYRDENETDEYKLNCLEIAIMNTGIEEEKLNKLKTMIRTRFIPKKDLKTIAEQLGIYIVLKEIGKHKDNCYYGDKNNVKINIGLIDSHYFIIEKTEYTSYSIKNYFDIFDKNGFNKIYKKVGEKYEKSNDRFINSFELVKILLENKETHLTEINMTNCGKFSTFQNRLFEYTTLPELSIGEYKQCEGGELKIPSIFIDKEKTKLHNRLELNSILNKDINPEEQNRKTIYHPFDFLYFDFEATTDENIHKEYMICSETRGGQKKYFNGSYCALNWLKSLDKNYICIAHNLRYDLQFLLKYIGNLSNIIKTGTKIRAVQGTFHNKDTGKTILLYFKDSYSLITMSLKNFGKCFNLNVKKEIMPYEAYNKETIEEKYIEIDYALQFIANEDKKEFIDNINEWGLIINDKYFNHIKYSKIYCEMDVTVLKTGYELFKEWMYQITELDIDYAVSIPQISHLFGLNSGVFDGCYKISGVARDFIQKCVVGGRCMTANNQKIKKSHKVDDFDGVNLYGSSMDRIDGFLLGLPKVWNNTIDIRKVDGYFLEIKVLDITKKRAFPLISKINDKGIRMFDNDIRGNIYVDKYGLEDLIKFQGLKFEIIRGYYFNEGRNNKINEFIYNLFQERKKKKDEGNPIQEVYKLLLNAFYGKTIMKPIDTEYNFIYGEEKMRKHLSYRFNNIKEFTKLSDGLYLFNEVKSIMSHFSLPHIGSEILSMSKRIMNEVMCLAEDLGIEIYYQDTDSMHIDARNIYTDNLLTGVEYLSEKFKEKYLRDLIGKNLGQFHSDFSAEKGAEDIISIESIFLGKKAYCDKLSYTVNGVQKYSYHCRLKGIPNKIVDDYADEEFNGDCIKMYNHLYDGTEIKFDIVNSCKFESNKDFTTSTRENFYRVVKF